MSTRTIATESLPRVRPRCCPTKVPGTNNGLLSYPTKMPCSSFSLPAGPACPFAELHALIVAAANPDLPVVMHEAICAKCYAKKGKYIYAKPSQQARFDWAVRCMRSPEGMDEFVDVMTRAIRRECQRMGVAYFRIHDSGDFFSPNYVRAWLRIVRALPDIKFWAPTRSYRAPWLEQLLELAAEPNVTMRPSALHFDIAPPTIPGMAAGSGANHEGQSCPAKQQKNECRTCRMCWDRPDLVITYAKH